MAAFAEGTTVQPETSQSEISGLLRKYGASGFAYGWQGAQAMVSFTAHDRQVRFILTLPTDPKAFLRSPAGKVRTPAAAQSALDAEVRRLWRCLLLAIKAKLEVVASGIATFEDEFLAHIVLPSGDVVGDRIRPEIANAYAGLPVRNMLALEAGPA